jgi:hypothetical protein
MPRHPVVLKDLAPLDAAYLAGLVDGEGTITIGFSRAYWNKIGWTIVRAYNSYRPVLDWARETCGGSVSVCTVGDDTFASKLARRQMFVWDIQGVAGAHILKQLLPHLKIKHEHAKLALACIGAPLATRVEMKKQIGRLSTKGGRKRNATDAELDSLITMTLEPKPPKPRLCSVCRQPGHIKSKKCPVVLASLLRAAKLGAASPFQPKPKRKREVERVEVTLARRPVIVTRFKQQQ